MLPLSFLLFQMKATSAESHSSLASGQREQLRRVQAALLQHGADARGALLALVRGAAAGLQRASGLDVHGHLASFVNNWVWA